MHKEQEPKNAVVLAMFGTSVPHALPGLLNIRNRMAARFPGTLVRMAFTSSIIRGIWRQRVHDSAYVRSHPEIPAEILTVQGPLAAIATLQDAGYHSIIVQAVHIAPAEEYTDLCSCVAGLHSIRTTRPPSRLFAELVVGRPALGGHDSRYSAGQDLRIAAESLADDVDLAVREKAALVYLGHGTKSMSAENVYTGFAAEMHRQYPETPVRITTIEGESTVEDIISDLRRLKIKSVLLKPFLLAAGGHVVRDMMGDNPQSLKTRLERAGFDVRPVVRGLGEQDRFAQIFVQHTADAASEADIELR